MRNNTGRIVLLSVVMLFLTALAAFAIATLFYCVLMDILHCGYGPLWSVLTYVICLSYLLGYVFAIKRLIEYTEDLIDIRF